jgi:hypothetical protein
VRPRAMAVVAAVVIAAAVRPAAAQDTPVAHTFEQLQILVQPSDTLTVTDDAGRQLRGRLLELSRTTLVLEVYGERTELTPDAVRTIKQRRSDSLRNGALWGLVAGAAYGATAVAMTGAEDESLGETMALAALVFGGVGTGAGVGIDALIRTNQVIYLRPLGIAESRLRISPILTRDRRGVLMAWTF